MVRGACVIAGDFVGDEIVLLYEAAADQTKNVKKSSLLTDLRLWRRSLTRLDDIWYK